MRLTRIYTRTGDTGETALGDLSRVPKTHPRVEAFGAVDETNAQLGLACADGSWKPGRYSFLTTTTEPTRRLQASASLVRTVSDRC